MKQNNIKVIDHPSAGFADTVREFLTDSNVPGGAALTANLFGDRACLEVTSWDSYRCTLCERELDLRAELPCAATIFDQFGNKIGENKIQHECGGWNTPFSAHVWVTEHTDQQGTPSS